MNLKLFNKVKKHIATYPKELVMDYFCEFASKEFKQNIDYANHPLSRLSCGTVGCIGGTGIFCSLKNFERPKTKEEYQVWAAKELSGIDTERVAKLFDIPSSEAEALFYFPFAGQAEEARYDETGPAFAYNDVRARLKKASAGTKKYADIVLEAIDICIDRCKEKKIVTIRPVLTFETGAN